VQTHFKPLIGLLFLSACGGVNHPMVTQLYEPEPIRADADRFQADAPSACRVDDVSPPVLETVTEEVEVTPAILDADGTVLHEATYRMETAQKIVRERVDHSFDRVCEIDLTPDFIASLQRALSARSLYAGPVNGLMNTETQAAIRAYQEPQGLDSTILSLAAARQLGLKAVARLDG